MNTTKIIEISNGRIAKITVKREITSEVKTFVKAIEVEHQGEENDDWADHVLLNNKYFYKVHTKEIQIMDSSYTATATTLTGYDWKRINDAITELEEKIKAEPYTLTEYYNGRVKSALSPKD